MNTQNNTDPHGGLPHLLRFDWLISGLNSLGTLWIIALMIIINIDVIGRTAFNAPLPGVLEFVRLSIIGIVFLQIGHTIRSGRITRSDALFQRIMKRWQRPAHLLRMFYKLGGTALFAILFYASYPQMIDAWVSGEYVGIQGYVAYPVWPIRLLILVGSVCGATQYLIFAWVDFTIAMGWREPVEEITTTGVEVLQ